MRKNIFLLLFVYLILASGVSFASETVSTAIKVPAIPGVIYPLNSKVQEAPLNKEVADTLLDILQNPAKLESLVQVLQGIQNQADNSKNTIKKDISIERSKVIDVSYVLQQFKQIGSHRSVKSYINFFKQELMSFSLDKILYLIFWIMHVVFFVSLSYFLEQILNYTFKIKSQRYKNKQEKFNLQNLLSQITYIIKLLAPVFVSVAISIVIVILYKVSFYTYIVELLCVYLGMRVVILLLRLIAGKFTSALFKRLKYTILKFFIVLFCFLVINSALLERYVSEHHSILLKINLFMCACVIVFFIIKIRYFMHLVIRKFAYPTSINKDEKSRTNLFLQKSYSSYIVVGIAFILFVIIFLFDYELVKGLLTETVLSVMLLMVLYFVYKLTHYLFYRYVVDNLEQELKGLINRHNDLEEVYKYLTVKKIWHSFGLYYKVINIILVAYLLDVIWKFNLQAYISKFITSWLGNTIVIILLGYFVVLFVSLCIIIYVQKKAIKMDLTEDYNVLRKTLSLYILCHKPYTLLIVVSMIIITLSAFGLSVTTLVASTGIITVVVAFGLKDILKNFFNAMLFLMEDSFSINDFVEISGFKGKVESMSLLYIKLRDIDGKLHMIPFSSIEVISNYTKYFGYAFMEIGVSYNSNIDHVNSVLYRIAENIKLEEDMKDVVVGDLDLTGIINLADFSVIIRCKIKTEPGFHAIVKARFLQRVFEEFKKENIEIPFPHRVLIQKDNNS